MLTVVSAAIWKTALVGLPKERVERFVLSCANVNVAETKRDNVSQPFHRVFGFGCQCQELWSGGKEVDDALEG